jgi:hypothetical protein
MGRRTRRRTIEEVFATSIRSVKYSWSGRRLLKRVSVEGHVLEVHRARAPRRSRCCLSSVEVASDGATTPVAFGNQAKNSVTSAHGCCRTKKNQRLVLINCQMRQITNPLSQELAVHIRRTLGKCC